ncbi:hypothetical protein Taro_048233 [Colocasia esculenta]|uniref:Uncharacterized protein n=1 Tax=Colocasia esculenta TaxID=4460 RepID=A0A843X6A3_COLES|nr:hypothetical protein [Colocasia esculenta]
MGSGATFGVSGGVREVGSLQWWLAFQQGSGVSCRRVLLLLLGARVASVVAVFARAVVGFVLGLPIRVVVSRRLREPTCGVAFTGAGLWSAELVKVGVFARAKQMLMCRVAPLVECCDTCLWLFEGFLSLWDYFFVVYRLVALCSGDAFPELLAIVLVRVALRTISGLTVPWWFWWRLSQDLLALLLQFCLL